MRIKTLAGITMFIFIIASVLTGCTGGWVNKEAVIPQESPKYIAEGIRRLSVIRDGEAVLDIAYEPEEYESSYEYWKIFVPYGKAAIVDTEAVLALFHVMEEMDLEETGEYPANIKDEMKESGTKVMLEYCSGDEGDDNSYRIEADSTATLLLYGGEEENIYYAAYEKNPEIIYKIKKEDMDKILYLDTFDLILKISAAINIDTIEKVIIDMDEETYEWNMKDEKYRSHYTELLSILLKKEIQEDKRGSFDKEALLALRFVRNVQDASDVTVEYRDYDSEYAAISVNGEEHFLVEKAEVEALKEKIANAP